MELAVKTLAGKAAGKITLDDAIFGIEDIRKDLLHRTVRWQLAKRQAGTHKTQTRSEVSVTTKKFIRQKGSGDLCRWWCCSRPARSQPRP